MEVTVKKLRIFRAIDGHEPFSVWLRQLKDQRGKQKIQARLVKAHKMQTSKKQKPTNRITKKKKAMPTIDYKDLLLKDLRDLDYAAGYLTACYEEGIDVFLLGIRDVAEAHGGLRMLSEETSLNRENLYDMLSKEGNPRLSSISSILDKLGFEVNIKAKLHGSNAA